ALGDGEAQAGPLGAAREEVVGAIEALEDPLAILFVDADPVVLDLDGDAAIGPPGTQPDLLVGSGELPCVVQEVEHYLRHGVAVNRRTLGSGVRSSCEMLATKSVLSRDSL